MTMGDITAGAAADGSNEKVTMLIVDVQNDFHPPNGSLAIPNASDDADRISSFVRDNADKITSVVATMDTHQKLHIAHPCFWYRGGGGDGHGQQHPDPFTIISSDDIKQGKWRPRDDLKLPEKLSAAIDPSVFDGASKVVSGTDSKATLDLKEYCVEYARRLEEKGRFQLCIWPEHCLIGSPGHALVDSVRKSLDEWTERTGTSVHWVHKGQNHFTEMYSAMSAEVPLNRETCYNYPLLRETLMQCDKLVVCGQAMSHCVNYTLRDIVQIWKQNDEYKSRCKIYLLTDCASSVPGFESASEAFLEDMEAAGVILIKSTDMEL